MSMGSNQRTLGSSVNLLPQSVLDRLYYQQTISTWIRWAGLVGSVAGSAIFFGQLLSSRENAKLARAHEMARIPRALQDENISMREKLRKNKSRMQEVAKQKTTHSPLALLELLTQIKTQVGGFLEVEKMSFLEAMANPNSDAGQIQLSLKTDSVGNTARIVALLQKSNRFQDVELVGPLQKQQGAHSDVRFTVQAHF